MQKKIESASLRFEVRVADESSVGTAFALNFGKLESSDNLIEFEMDTHVLVPGKYHIVLGLFEVNELRAYNDIDVVEKAMGFEIVDNKDSLGVNWLGGYWEHLKLNDLRVQM